MQVARTKLYSVTGVNRQRTLLETDAEHIKATTDVTSHNSQSKETHQLALREIQTALTRFRLSRNEVKVYLFLARHGAQRAQKIAESIEVQRTEAYKILRNLENKGVILRMLCRPTKFVAVPFERVLDREIEERRQRVNQLRRKKEDLLRLWVTLPKIDDEEGEKETLQIFEGKRQIEARVSELVKFTKKRISAVVNDRHLIWLYNATFFEDLEEEVGGGGVEARVLTEYSPASNFVIEHVKPTACDFAFLQLKEQPSFIVTDAGTVLLIMEGEEDRFYAMETTYSSIIRSYENLFELLWRSHENN